MHLRGVWLLMSPKSLYELVKHKLGLVDIISKSIHMDGIPQVTTAIKPRREG